MDGRSWEEGEETREQMERRAKTLKRCVTPDDNVLFSSWTGQDATASVLKLKAQIFLTGERGVRRSWAVKKSKSGTRPSEGRRQVTNTFADGCNLHSTRKRLTRAPRGACCAQNRYFCPTRSPTLHRELLLASARGVGARLFFPWTSRKLRHTTADGSLGQPGRAPAAD